MAALVWAPLVGFDRGADCQWLPGSRQAFAIESTVASPGASATIEATEDMSDSLTRYSGPNHEGAASTSPYGQSRMAPAIELVDVAKEIAQANALIGAATADKLGLIAEQIRALQEQAREILEKARRDAVLHTAECRFQKIPGQAYHLYRKGEGEGAKRYFSMLSPDDWRGHPPTPSREPTGSRPTSPSPRRRRWRSATPGSPPRAGCWAAASR